jgi:hypothetical protein
MYLSCRSTETKLDDVFERKDDITIAVKRELNEATTYGYTIINTLVTDIDPDIQVKMP